MKEDDVTHSQETELLLLFQVAISGSSDRTTAGSQVGERRGSANLWGIEMDSQAVAQA